MTVQSLAVSPLESVGRRSFEGGVRTLLVARSHRRLCRSDFTCGGQVVCAGK